MTVIPPRPQHGERGWDVWLTAVIDDMTERLGVVESDVTPERIRQIVNDAVAALPQGATQQQVADAIAAALEPYETQQAVGDVIDQLRHVNIPGQYALQPGTPIDSGYPLFLIGIPDDPDRITSYGAILNDPTLPSMPALDADYFSAWDRMMDWSTGPSATGGLGAEGLIVAAIDGKIYFGGGDGNWLDGNDATWMKSYDPATGTFRDCASYPNGDWALDYCVWAVADGKIYVIADSTANEDDTWPTWIYDPVADTWASGPVIPVGFNAWGDEQPGQPPALAISQTMGYQVGRTVYWPATGVALDIDTSTWRKIADIDGPNPIDWVYSAASTGLAPDGKIWVVSHTNIRRYFDTTTETWGDLTGSAVEMGGDGYTSIVFDNDGNWYHFGGGAYGSDPTNGELHDGVEMDDGNGHMMRIAFPPLPGLVWDGTTEEGVAIDENATVVIDGVAYMVSGYEWGVETDTFDYVSPYIIPFDLTTKTWGDPILIPPNASMLDTPTSGQLATWRGNPSSQDVGSADASSWVENFVYVNQPTVVPELPVAAEGWTFYWAWMWNPSASQVKARKAQAESLVDSTANGTVTVVDPVSGEVIAQIPLKPQPGDIQDAILGYFLEIYGLRVRYPQIQLADQLGWGRVELIGEDANRTPWGSLGWNNTGTTWWRSGNNMAWLFLDADYQNRFAVRRNNNGGMETKLQWWLDDSLPELVVKDADPDTLYFRDTTGAEHNLIDSGGGGGTGNANVIETVAQYSAVSGNVQLLDPTEATMHNVTVVGDTTLTLPAPGAGKSFTVLVTEDFVGGHAWSWNGPVVWDGGTEPAHDTGARKATEYRFVCYDGANYLAS